MIIYLKSVLFGVVQGITEFLPISSSGHLVILHEWIDMPFTNELAFDVALHAASLAAVLFVLRREIWLVARDWLGGFFGRGGRYTAVGWYIILATIPAGVAGILFGDVIKNQLRSVGTVAVMLVLAGLLFILVEKLGRGGADWQQTGWRRSLLIGLAQAIALIPGTSRSGITVAAGVGSGLGREAAVKFSFLLSIPAIIGAAVLEAPGLFASGIDGEELAALAVAAAASLLSALLAIKFFLNFARRHSLVVFAFYRFILAAVLIVYFYC